MKKTSIALIFACILLQNFGNMFTYDITQLLSEELIIQFDASQLELNSFYSVVSGSAIIACLVFPAMIDLLGLSLTNLLFVTIHFLGNLVLFLGVRYQSLRVMLVGRLFVGMGAEICFISAFTIMEKHFKNRNITLVNSCISILFQLYGAAASYSIIPIFRDARDLNSPFFFGAIACAISTLIVSIYNFVVYVEGVEGMSNLTARS